MIQEVDMQGRRRQVSQGSGKGQFESKGRKGGKVILKNEVSAQLQCLGSILSIPDEIENGNSGGKEIG